MQGVRTRVVVAVAIALAAAALLSCGDGYECGAGTHAEGGACVADIGCGAGTVDDGQGACVPDGSVVCPQGTRFVDGRCELDPSACAAGTVLVGGQCVPEGEDIAVDLEEAAEPNDEPAAPAGRLTLGAVGTRTTLHGCVVPRADADGNGNLDPDRDAWLVTTDAPATLELTADGVQGLVAGFAVISADPALATPLRTWQRFGINLTGDTAHRQVYLPAAGTYALMMTDARSLLLAGTGAGGPTACYYTTIAHVATPAPQPLVLPQTAATDAGDVRLYTYTAADRGRIVRVTANTGSSTMVPAMVALRGAERTLASAVRGNRSSATVGGLEPAEVVTVVVDMEYDWGLAPQPYTLDAVDMRAQPLPADGTVTLTKQNGQTPLAPYADYDYLYFDVPAAGAIVRFDVTAASGATPVPFDLAITRRDVLGPADLIALVDAFGSPGRDGFVGQFVRFDRAGRYYLVLQDPEGTSGETYTITSRWVAQQPTALALGTPTAPLALPATGSAFATIDLTNPTWIEAAVTTSGFPAGTDTARLALYDLAGAGWLDGGYQPVQTARVSAAGASQLGRVMLHDARDFLVRVEPVGAPAANATYTLVVRDRMFVDLGTLTSAAPIDRTGLDVIAAGAVQRYLVRGTGIGDALTARVMPAAAVDLAIRRVGVDEATIGAIVDAAGAGGAEALRGNFLFEPNDWVAFEVQNASATTATAIDLHLTATTGGYQGTVTSATWTDACSGPGTAILGTNLDDELLAARAFPAGWDVRLFGAPVTHYVIGANGLVTLGGATLAPPACSFGCYENAAIPTAAAPNGFVAPFWNDLAQVKLCERVDPQRVTIQWTGREYAGDAAVATQVTFWSNGTIELVYGSAPAHKATGSSATVGLERADGADGFQLGFDAPLPLAGKKITITPAP